MTKQTLENLLDGMLNTKNHYKSEFFLTKGLTKRICFRIFNISSNALQKAMIQKTDGKLTEAVNTLLKGFDKIEKIKNDFGFIF